LFADCLAQSGVDRVDAVRLYDPADDLVSVVIGGPSGKFGPQANDRGQQPLRGR
jgi:hypothetical protein